MSTSAAVDRPKGPHANAYSSSEDSTTGPVCSGHMEPCPGGEADCCDGLMCCSGLPIPPGQEYCSSMICPVSDRNQKENFEAIDPREVLAKVAALEVTRWNYRFEDPSVRHLGPMAQDFKAAFGLGESERHIGTVDADGVSMAAIKALNERIEKKNARIAELETRLARLESLLIEGDRNE